MDRRLIGLAPLDGCPFLHECRAGPIQRWLSRLYVPPTQEDMRVTSLTLAEEAERVITMGAEESVTAKMMMMMMIALILVSTMVGVLVRGWKKRAEYEPIPTHAYDAPGV